MKKEHLKRLTKAAPRREACKKEPRIAAAVPQLVKKHAYGGFFDDFAPFA